MSTGSRSFFNRLQHEPALAQPAVLNSWLVWVISAAVFLIPFFLPIAQSLRRHPVIGALGEQLHIPLMACLHLLIYWKGPLRGRIWLTALAIAVVGALVEFVQNFVGRSALFEDWLLDLVGIGLVVGFVLWRGHKNKFGKWLLVALLFYIPGQLWYLPFSIMAKYEAKLTFPVIADFEGQHYSWLWKDIGGSRIGFAPEQGSPNTVLLLEGQPPRRWPGARLVHFPENWTDYSQLVIDARVARADRDSLRFGVRIDDFQGRRDKVWASQGFFATRQWQTFVMPIAGRKVLHGDRMLDLKDVESLLVFVSNPTDSFALEVDNIRLQ